MLAMRQVWDARACLGDRILLSMIPFVRGLVWPDARMVGNVLHLCWLMTIVLLTVWPSPCEAAMHVDSTSFMKFHISSPCKICSFGQSKARVAKTYMHAAKKDLKHAQLELLVCMLISKPMTILVVHAQKLPDTPCRGVRESDKHSILCSIKLAPHNLTSVLTHD